MCDCYVWVRVCGCMGAFGCYVWVRLCVCVVGGGGLLVVVCLRQSIYNLRSTYVPTFASHYT